MVNFLKVVAILLLVLPALITASCQLSVESNLEDTQDRYNIYRATVHNVGDAAAADIKLTTPVDIRRVSGLKSCDDGYSLPRDAIKEGGIAAGDSYSFKYKVRKGTNVIFTASCENDDEETTTTQPPSAPTTRPKATTTTTRRGGNKKATTTTTTKKAATTTTKAPAQQTTTTTQAPAQQTTTTTTQKAATTTTTKKATTTTTTKAPAVTTTTTKAPAVTTTTTKQATVTTTTTKPASGTGKKCAGNTWWAPAPLTTWQWQLTGTIDTSFNVQVYDIDLFDNSADTIAKLHSQGRAVICYFSTQYENWRPDAASFTSAVLGKNLDDWAGEKYVDIRSPVIRAIMTARMQTAVSKGCDAVEPDNVDGYQASTGFPLTAADQLNYNQFLANTAHSLGLSIGLKNDGDQAKALQPYFDWALNEQCNQYSECDAFNSFISAGKAVFNCEYSGSASSVCPKMNTAKISTIFKALALDAKIATQCCSSASGGCSAAPSSCVSSSGALLQEETQTAAAPQEQVAEAHASSASTTYLAAAAAFAAVVALAL